MQNPKRKKWTFRLPPAVLDQLRIQAARETINRGRCVSINELAVRALARAVEEPSDQEQG